MTEYVKMISSTCSCQIASLDNFVDKSRTLNDERRELAYTLHQCHAGERALGRPLNPRRRGLSAYEYQSKQTNLVLR